MNTQTYVLSAATTREGRPVDINRDLESRHGLLSCFSSHVMVHDGDIYTKSTGIGLDNEGNGWEPNVTIVFSLDPERLGSFLTEVRRTSKCWGQREFVLMTVGDTEFLKV
jgi:hypothetical protein